MFHFISEWYTLGLLLNVPQSSLSTIRTNNPDDQDCLRETLKHWLRQTDPSPTWHELTEAMQLLDPDKAHEIRQRYCVGEERSYEEGI